MEDVGVWAWFRGMVRKIGRTKGRRACAGDDAAVLLWRREVDF